MFAKRVEEPRETSSGTAQSEGRALGAALGAALCVLLALPVASPALAQRAPSQAARAARRAFRGADLQGKDGPFAKVGMALAQLYYERLAFPQGSAAAQSRGARPTLLPVRDGRVRIDAVASESAAALRGRLEALGLKHGATAGPVVSGWLPVKALAEAAQLSALRFARPSLAAVHRRAARSGGARSGAVRGQARAQAAEPVVGQGVRALRAGEARDQFGVDGSGVTVGVLSDSFDCLGGAESDSLGGEIPPNVLLPTDEGDCENGTDEGRAMVQIVADIAPGADQRFKTAFNGVASFANNIRTLASDEKADVIVDDIIYFNEPMFAVGPIAQAVNDVFDQGVAYFSSAGNSDGQSYVSAAGFRDSGQDGPLEGGPLHDFASSPGRTDPYQSVTVLEDAQITISLQWAQPYATTSTSSPGASSDLDLVLLDRNGAVVDSAVFDNVDRDPIEILQYKNDGSVDANADGVADTTFRLGIELVDGPAPEVRMKYVYSADVSGSVTLNEYDAPHSTLYGHANARGAAAVGAAPYFNTPAFNSVVTVEDGRIVVLGDEGPEDTDSIIEPFSALGGTPILLGPSGEHRAGKTPRKPDIVAPDGTNNTFFGSDLPASFDDIGDDDDFPNFFGTSAAAPHAAGVAALMKSLNPDLAPARLYGILEDTALDMDNPRTAGFDEGFDFKTGNGFVDAFAALGEVPTTLQLLAEVVPAEGRRSQVRLSITTAEPGAAEQFVIERCFGTRAACGTGGDDFRQVRTIAATGESSFDVTVGLPTRSGTYTFLVRQVNGSGRGSVLRTTEVTLGLEQGEDFELTGVFPNPFQARTELRFVVPKGESVKVTATLYDALGRRVRRFFDGTVEGQAAIPLQAGSLSSGVYFVRVEGEDFLETKEVVLVR